MQIIRITSEALQSTIRRLLPSQQGFGEDLQASNVIQPIIDLTPTAEGSALPVDLARSLAFGSQTAFQAENSLVTIANTPGFYRINGAATASTGGIDVEARFLLRGSLGDKNIWLLKIESTSDPKQYVSESFDFIVFLDTGESVLVQSNAANAKVGGSSRQLADRYGNIVNPSGFTFE